MIIPVRHHTWLTALSHIRLACYSNSNIGNATEKIISGSNVKEKAHRDTLIACHKRVEHEQELISFRDIRETHFNMSHGLQLASFPASSALAKGANNSGPGRLPDTTKKSTAVMERNLRWERTI